MDRKAGPAPASTEKTAGCPASFPFARARLDRGSASGLFTFEDAPVQVAHNQPGQPLVMHEQALADRIGILPGDRDSLLEDLVGADSALDMTLDKADPVLDDLRLFPEVILAAGLAVAGHDRLDVERGDAVKRRQPFPRVAFLQPAAAFVEHVVAGEH